MKSIRIIAILSISVLNNSVYPVRLSEQNTITLSLQTYEEKLLKEIEGKKNTSLLSKAIRKYINALKKTLKTTQEKWEQVNNTKKIIFAWDIDDTLIEFMWPKSIAETKKIFLPPNPGPITPMLMLYKQVCNMGNVTHYIVTSRPSSDRQRTRDDLKRCGYHTYKEIFDVETMLHTKLKKNRDHKAFANLKKTILLKLSKQTAIIFFFDDKQENIDACQELENVMAIKIPRIIEFLV